MVKVFQLAFYKNNKFSDLEILAEVIEAWHCISGNKHNKYK